MPDGQVLVIEDDDDSREMMVALLHMLGYGAVGAEGGVVALNSLRAGLRPSMILMDLTLPRMDGREVAAELARDPALAAIPVIVVSGDASLGRRARDIGARGFLQKPFTPEALRQVVSRYSTDGPTP